MDRPVSARGKADTPRGFGVQTFGSVFPWKEGAFHLLTRLHFAHTTLWPSLVLLIKMLSSLEAAAFPWFGGAPPFLTQG